MQPSVGTSPSVNEQYNQLLKKLYSWNSSRQRTLGAAFHLKSDLEAMKGLADIMGHPERKYKTVHVGGTNGKGSISLKCAVALERQGFKTGLFTSPHISSFRERIKVNREYI